MIVILMQITAITLLILVFPGLGCERFLSFFLSLINASTVIKKTISSIIKIGHLILNAHFSWLKNKKHIDKENQKSAYSDLLFIVLF